MNCGNTPQDQKVLILEGPTHLCTHFGCHLTPHPNSTPILPLPHFLLTVLRYAFDWHVSICSDGFSVTTPEDWYELPGGSDGPLPLDSPAEEGCNMLILDEILSPSNSC